MKTAKQILEEKNFVQKKFDTNGFNELVARFFSEHDVSAVLKVESWRFVCLSCPPDCGYIDMTSQEGWEKALDRGYISDIHLLFCGFHNDYPPTIAVDEPFCKNAVHMLSIMGGYVVKKRRGNYIISLL